MTQDDPTSATPAGPSGPALPAGEDAVPSPTGLGTGPTAAEIFSRPPPHVPAELSPAASGASESHPSPHGTVVLESRGAAPVAIAEPAAPSAPVLRRHLMILGGLIGLTMLLVSAGFYTYHLDTFYNIHRERCLIALIILGAGATLCLAGMMQTLNALVEFRWRWYWRWLMLFGIRLILVAELGSTGVALLCGGMLLFHQDFPASNTGTYSPPPAPPGDHITISPVPEGFAPEAAPFPMPPPPNQPPPSPPG